MININEIRGSNIYNNNDGFLRISAGGGNNSNISYIDLSASSIYGDMSCNIVFGTGGIERMRITSNGFIGIGITDPSSNLCLAGTFVASGNIKSFGTVSVSDERLKKDIYDLKDISLNLIDKLKPVYFNWKDDINVDVSFRNQKDVGFIAQEIEKIIPIATTEYLSLFSSNVYKSIKYEKLIPYIIKSIQELNKKIKKLTKENRKLKKDNKIFKIKLNI